MVLGRLTISERASLVSLLIFFVLLASLYNLALPVLEGPDEMWHFAYVKHLADGRGLPVHPKLAAGTIRDSRVMFYQPPLYYAVGSIWIGGVDIDDPSEVMSFNPHWGYRARAPERDNRNLFLHSAEEGLPYQGTALAVRLLRLLSTMAGTVAVAATYFIAREVTGKSHRFALVAAGFVALNPQFLHLSATVNNDSLVTAAIALALWWLLRTLQGATAIPGLPVGGALLGIAVLAKDSAVFLLLFVPMVLLARAKSVSIKGGTRRSAMFVLLSAVIMAGWWYARNWTLYGSLLGAESQIGPIAGNTIGELAAKLLATERSFWASFGWENIFAHEWVYAGLRLLDGLALAGLAAHFASELRRGRITASQALTPSALLVVWALLILSGYLAWAMLNPWAVGRHLFAALPSLAVLLALGLDRWRLPRSGVSLAAPALAFVAAVAVWAPFGYIAPAFAPPPRYASQTDIDIANPVRAKFDGSIELLGYRIDQAERPSEPSVWVTLYWHPLMAIEENYSVFIHVLDEQSNIVAQRDTFPGLGNYPTSSWIPGEVIQDTYPVHLPPSLPPASYRVSVGLYLLSTMERIPVVGADLAGEGDAVDIGQMDLSVNQLSLKELISHRWRG